MTFGPRSPRVAQTLLRPALFTVDRFTSGSLPEDLFDPTTRTRQEDNEDQATPSELSDYSIQSLKSNIEILGV
jgi:hypothetical protein